MIQTVQLERSSAVTPRNQRLRPEWDFDRHPHLVFHSKERSFNIKISFFKSPDRIPRYA
jgi:hypothetical protein